MISWKYVYIIKNTVTKRKYVGFAQNPSDRFATHMCSLRGSRSKIRLMQEDFDKYGKESFVLVEYGCYEDELLAHQQEIFLMYVLRTKDIRFGYNYMDKSGTSLQMVKTRYRIPSMYLHPYMLSQFFTPQQIAKLKTLDADYVDDISADDIAKKWKMKNWKGEIIC